MTDWRAGAVAADQVVNCIQNGMRVFIHGAAATPTTLLDALVRRTDLEQVHLFHLHLDGPLAFANRENGQRFFSNSFFTGPGLRQPIEEGRADFIPVFLSDIPGLLLNRRIPIDVAILQLSPPDRHGYCSLGTSVDAALAASHCAKYVIAEINERMPRTLGNTLVPMRRLTSY